MYNEYFGFKEAPFAIAPDPRYLYMTAQHREALAHLVYGLNSEGGCILLTGEVGTGKTTICRCLLDQIPDQANVALVLNPKVSEIELLETICDELHISYPGSDNSVKTYTDRIYQYLIESHRNNEKTVLIIDEAQNLDSTVLEQLRLLTNLETNQRKLLQIIILGQPELLEILARNEMRQLAQRITARFHLQPLTCHEVKAYVSHRLAVAGQNIQLFPENSIKRLYKLSNGIPRLINIICDRALLGAYVENQYSVSPRILKKAATEVFGELKNVEKLHRKKRWIFPLAVTSAVIVFVIAAVLYRVTIDDPLFKKPVQAKLPVTSDNDTSALSQSTPSGDEPEQKPDKASSADFVNNGTTANSKALVTEIGNKPGTTSTQNNTDNVSTQNTETVVIDKILNSASNHASAYQQLFNAWQISYDEKSGTTACKQATTFSLNCLHKKGNLNNLKVHNRPAVLPLVNSKGESRYVTITTIEGDSAIVYSNNTPYRITLAELDRHWYGQFILLWEKPRSYVSAILPGDTGKIISWLNTKLNVIYNSLPDTTITTYNDDMVEKVKSFQAEHGLTADGIVGPVTIIHLNTQSGMQAPSLVASPSTLITQQG